MQPIEVLVVENDCIINADICEVLEDSGIIVTSVHNAGDAVVALDGGGYLKGLLTDIDLGDGLNGFDVARHAREVYPNLAVLFISGARASRHVADGVARSIFIPKPFQPRQLCEALGQAIGLESAGAPASRPA